MSIEELRKELKTYYFKHSYAEMCGDGYIDPIWDNTVEYDSASSPSVGVTE